MERSEFNQRVKLLIQNYTGGGRPMYMRTNYCAGWRASHSHYPTCSLCESESGCRKFCIIDDARQLLEAKKFNQLDFLALAELALEAKNIGQIKRLWPIIQRARENK